MEDSNGPRPSYFDFVPKDADRCAKCGATGKLHKYKGDLHCEKCLNQRMAQE